MVNLTVKVPFAWLEAHFDCDGDAGSAATEKALEELKEHFQSALDEEGLDGEAVSVETDLDTSEEQEDEPDWDSPDDNLAAVRKQVNRAWNEVMEQYDE